MFKYIEEIDFKLPPLLLEKILKETDNKECPVTDTIFGKMLDAAKNDSYVENKFYNKEAFEFFKKSMSTRVAQLTPYSYSNLITSSILKLLPERLLQYNPRIQFQTITNSENYSPHRDYVRLSSLFYLIKSNSSVTKWWEPTEKFKDYFMGDYKYVPPEYNQIQVAKEYTLEENKWYVFDHESLHSVHTPNREEFRISLLVSFADLPAEDLYNIMVEEGYATTKKQGLEVLVS